MRRGMRRASTGGPVRAGRDRRDGAAEHGARHPRRARSPRHGRRADHCRLRRCACALSADRIIASWGKRLIDWLQTYTFPEEMRFGDAGLCRRHRGAVPRPRPRARHDHGGQLLHLAPRKRRRLLRRRRGRAACGPPPARPAWTATRQRPCGTARSGPMTTVRALLGAGTGWAARPTPSRRASRPTSTPEQLDALGALWAAHPDCLMQTHLSEQTDEVAWVAALFPGARLSRHLRGARSAGARGLYGHAIHLDRASATGCARPARRWSIARPPTPSSARGCSTWRGG